MKETIAVLLLLLGNLLPLNASTTPSSAKTYEKGTILRVEKHDTTPSTAGQNPSDAPLADPQTYAYDVSVRVNCGTYVGRYESWYDYVPSVLSPQEIVRLRLTRHVMYVNVPNENEVEMSIVSRHVERGPCTVKN
jgi:hypothetical protein